MAQVMRRGDRLSETARETETETRWDGGARVRWGNRFIRRAGSLRSLQQHRLTHARLALASRHGKTTQAATTARIACIAEVLAHQRHPAAPRHRGDHRWLCAAR